MNKSVPLAERTGPDKITYEISTVSDDCFHWRTRRTILRHIRVVTITPTRLGHRRAPYRLALCDASAIPQRPDNELDLSTATCRKCIRLHAKLTEENPGD